MSILTTSDRIFTLAEPESVLPPTGPRLGYVLNNYERAGFSRPTEFGAGKSVRGMPDTYKLVYPDRVPLDPFKQQYWFDLLELSGIHLTIQQLKEAFASLTVGWRAFTNKRGWDNGYADYINGVNVAEEAMQFEPVITGGNVVELAGDPVRTGGKLCWPIKCLVDVPDIAEVNHIDTPWFVFKATISRRDHYDVASGRWMREDLEIPFPQLDGRDVPVPLFSRREINYIEVSRVVELHGGPIPETYRY